MSTRVVWCMFLCGLAFWGKTEGPGFQGAPFVQLPDGSGFSFNHENGMQGDYLIPEVTGSGCAVFDFDRDGDLDVYMVQSGAHPEVREDGTMVQKAGKSVDRLFRNDLSMAQGKMVLRFVDITEASGIVADGYGMGVAAGDINGDGLPDLYITNLGPNQLWINLGNGRFEERTESWGAQDTRWSCSAAFFDYDRDGHLDLYVTNYVDFDYRKPPDCYATNSARDFCGPGAFDPVGDSLFHNVDGKRFELATKRLQGLEAWGAGLGLTISDFNQDGWLDCYVANDGCANLLWMNQKDGSFMEEALFSGVALNMEGSPEASMGVTAGDFDNDGDPDIFMTHIMEESHTLFLNQGDGFFEDTTKQVGISMRSRGRTAFGTLWFDLDNDGWLDLATFNGAVRIILEQAARGLPYPCQQPNQLFWNDQGKRFVEISEMAGDPFLRQDVSRGAAFGDLDNDGDVDLVLNNNQGKAQLLINQVGQDHPWLGLTLRVSDGACDALGTQVWLHFEDASEIWRVANTAGGFCSSQDPRVLFGWNPGRKPKTLKILWPDGVEETGPCPAPEQYHILIKGQWKGKP